MLGLLGLGQGCPVEVLPIGFGGSGRVVRPVEAQVGHDVGPLGGVSAHILGVGHVGAFHLIQGEVLDGVPELYKEYISYLKLLLNSNGIVDFLKRYELVNSMIEADKELIAELTELSKQIELEKQDLENDKVVSEKTLVRTNESYSFDIPSYEVMVEEMRDWVVNHKELYPNIIPNSIDTIYDMASLTKVVCTTTCLMQLVEKGLLRIFDPVSKYFKEFKFSRVF